MAGPTTRQLYQLLTLRYKCAADGRHHRCKRRLGLKRQRGLYANCETLRRQLSSQLHPKYVLRTLKAMADIKICWQHKRDSVDKLVLLWLQRILGQEYASYMGRDGHALLEAANEPDTTENNHEDGTSAGGRAHHRSFNIVAALDERMRVRRSRTQGSTVLLRKASSSIVASASFRPEASLSSRASPSGISAPELSSLSNDTSVQRWLDQLPDEEPHAPAPEIPSSYHTVASETSSDPAACYVCGKGILRDTSTFTCGGCGRVGHAEHILMHHWFNSLRGPRWQCRTCHWQAVPPWGSD